MNPYREPCPPPPPPPLFPEEVVQRALEAVRHMNRPCPENLTIDETTWAIGPLSPERNSWWCKANKYPGNCSPHGTVGIMSLEFAGIRQCCQEQRAAILALAQLPRLWRWRAWLRLKLARLQLDPSNDGLPFLLPKLW